MLDKDKEENFIEIKYDSCKGNIVNTSYVDAKDELKSFLSNKVNNEKARSDQAYKKEAAEGYCHFSKKTTIRWFFYFNIN